MKTSASLALVLAAAAAGFVPPAAAQSTVESKLRDALRQTTLDLRSAQDENAQLKAKLAALPPPKPEAPPEDTAKAQKLQSALRSQSAKTAGLQQQLDEARKALAQSQTAYTQTATAAKTRDAEARKLEAEAAPLNARVQRCDRDNATLVTISEELITRYKNKSVGAAMRDEEPLTGLHRVQLEKISQDYHGRIVDATGHAPEPSSDAAPAAASPTPSKP